MSSVVRHYDVTELHPSLHPPVAVPLGRQQSTRIRGGIRWSPHSSPDDGLGTMATNSHTSPQCWATCEERELQLSTGQTAGVRGHSGTIPQVQLLGEARTCGRSHVT